jgi:dTDP-4-amino-4,6-dideoxygalactose transaminase
VRHPARDRLAELLRAEGIQVGLHYSPAAHRHAAFADLPASSRPVELPESEAWAAEELSLPMFAELSDAEVQRVAVACRAACTAIE